MLCFLSQNGLWTAYQQFIDNLRQTVPSLNGALAGNPIQTMGQFTSPCRIISGISKCTTFDNTIHPHE
ncbi:hypothetical protein [Methanobacterium spitsbergense]|uniref:Uncharacterized protein n=1 Tax=Methanobacterium spitsbergense TaxID=2874285 RepID=A0A8T5UZZ4_9EURY|nr:hypothetical protein [Methanobacterium spitsbergense]MBZ2166760.1 hypothetical protein [Methanobacterium spitsbergense]